MKEIPLTRGYVALVDDEDYEWLMQHNWQANVCGSNVYARRTIRNKVNPGSFRMHREVLGITDLSIQIDHIDRNGLNNQRNNLRVCTKEENAHNRSLQGGASIYKGVTYSKRYKLWVSRIMINKVPLYLGTFDNEVKAAYAYNLKAVELFGEFAHLNDLGDIEFPAEDITRDLTDRHSHRRGISKYKGVQWNNTKGKWRVVFIADQKRKYGGFFTNEEDAARAYNKIALDYFGQGTFQNKIG